MPADRLRRLRTTRRWRHRDRKRGRSLARPSDLPRGRQSQGALGVDPFASSCARIPANRPWRTSTSGLKAEMLLPPGRRQAHAIVQLRVSNWDRSARNHGPIETDWVSIRCADRFTLAGDDSALARGSADRETGLDHGAAGASTPGNPAFDPPYWCFDPNVGSMTCDLVGALPGGRDSTPLRLRRPQRPARLSCGAVERAGPRWCRRPIR